MTSYLGGAALVFSLGSGSVFATTISNPGPDDGTKVTINAVGDKFDIVYGPYTQTQEGNAVQGTLETMVWVELMSYEAGIIDMLDVEIATFKLTVDNLGSNTGARVTGLGFDTLTPDAVGAYTTTAGWFALLDENFQTGGVSNVDLCLTSGSGNNCNGGANGGILPGVTGTVINLTLAYADGTSLASGLMFDTPVIRYQSITGVPGGATGLSAKLIGGFTITGDDDGTNQEEVPTVPEPGTMFLMGTGLVGLGLWRWQKGAKSQS